jgi:hypothetical protein
MLALNLEAVTDVNFAVCRPSTDYGRREAAAIVGMARNYFRNRRGSDPQ